MTRLLEENFALFVCCVTFLKNDKAKFKAILRKYRHTLLLLCGCVCVCVCVYRWFIVLLLLIVCSIVLCTFLYMHLWLVPYPTVFMTRLWIHEIYVFMYVCMYVCMYLCIYVCMYLTASLNTTLYAYKTDQHKWQYSNSYTYLQNVKTWFRHQFVKLIQMQIAVIQLFSVEHEKARTPVSFSHAV